jgi:hypothetical protein
MIVVVLRAGIPFIPGDCVIEMKLGKAEFRLATGLAARSSD